MGVWVFLRVPRQLSKLDLTLYLLALNLKFAVLSVAWEHCSHLFDSKYFGGQSASWLLSFLKAFMPSRRKNAMAIPVIVKPSPKNTNSSYLSYGK